MNKILILVLVLCANSIYADSHVNYTENDYWAEVEKMHSGGFSDIPESELSGYNEDNSIHNSEPTKPLEDLVDLTEDMNHFQKIIFGLLKDDKISVEEAEKLLEENE